MQKIVKQGRYKYSDIQYEKIIIVEQDWDELYEEGYSDFVPNLNDKGLVYFIHFSDYWLNEYGNISSRSISIPFLSEKDALKYASLNVNGLSWDKLDLEKLLSISQKLPHRGKLLIA
ncbi:hypothetical protein NG800_006575 [Epilithonimonas ginsengisoli]|uniref:Uncharacterized protein n=1 Tax=Epilithonimonas ginsengisoli TaxID=1245592 RepID=A0ABU4JG19_9FLAO|nr:MULTISPECIES: hypothetical protein [Chryseobacterium group]MBV6879196.1 hypothetical protein [Epilithonimonas sp. FP105]MDW8548567.1 hypothetical protein [Epilithonimonas ginsengisoli]OAH75443.1 hypothetical protein AXA65_03680 [Chryseobacterium sp. FP211-J200]